jgi:hypothetical protein
MSRFQQALIVLRWGFWALLILAPLMVTMGLLMTRQEATYWDLSPLWTDEAHYWHQAKSFAEVGFTNGYYSVQENPAPAPFSGYFAWGVFIPALYGAFASVLGWYPVSMPLLNLAWLMLTLLVVVIVMRPRIWQSVALSLGIVLLPTFLTTYFSTLLPVLQMVLALWLGVGFVGLLRDEQPNLRGHGWLLLGLMIASLVRVTWAFLLLPYALLLVRGRSWRAFVLAIITSGVGMLALVGWYQWTAAPFPNAFNAILATLQNDFSAGIIALLDNINLNVNLLSQGDPVEQWGRWHLALISMALLPWGLVLVVRGRDQRVMLAKSLGWQIALHSYNLLVTLALVVVLYDIGEWRDLRIIAPRILLSLVLFVGMNQRFLVLVAILPLVFVLPDSLRIHDIWSGFHINPERPAQFEQWSQDLPDVLAYQKDAPSRWCNTVYHSTWYLFNQVPMLMAMPAGMGLTYPDVEAPTLPLRSRYLLLTDDDFALIGDTLEVTRLRDMPNGALYLNADAPCPTE